MFRRVFSGVFAACGRQSRGVAGERGVAVPSSLDVASFPRGRTLRPAGAGVWIAWVAVHLAMGNYGWNLIMTFPLFVLPHTLESYIPLSERWDHMASSQLVRL